MLAYNLILNMEKPKESNSNKTVRTTEKFCFQDRKTKYGNKSHFYTLKTNKR